MPQKHVYTVVCMSIFFFVGLIGLLFYEYRSLMYYRDRLQTIKTEYHANMHMVKQWMFDYQQSKQRLAVLESLLERTDGSYDDGDMISSATALDMYTKQFSTESDDQDSFVTINRDLEYLKQQSQDYIKKQNLELLFLQVPEDMWLEYTDALLVEQKPKKVVTSQKRKPIPKKRIMRSASSIVRSKRTTDTFSWPVKRSSFWLSSLFGRRKKVDGSWGFHTGIDMAAMKGTPVHAAAGGVVIEARNSQRGYGNTIVIKHNNKYKTRYAHLNAIHVSVGQVVRRGKHIGDVGDTGFVRSAGKDASHLHFELYVLGERVNPLYYLA